MSAPAWLLSVVSLLPAANDVTWIEHVQPIVAAHCSGCHVQTGPGPFPLISYDDLARRSAFVLAVIESGRMPPWLPDDSGPPLRDVNRLNQQQIDVLAAWVDQGMPRGDDDSSAHPSDVAPQTTDQPTGETHHEDDLVLKMAAPWAVPTEGPRDMHTFVLPVDNAERLFVQSVAWTSQLPQAVHTVTFLADGTGTAKQLDLMTPDAGYDSMGDVGVTPSGALGAIGPGVGRFTLPEGYAFVLPFRADVVAEVHFLPTGLGGTFQGNLSFGLSEQADPSPVQALRLMDIEISVPPDAREHVLNDAWTLPCAVELLGALPRGGDHCRSIELLAAPPDSADTKPAKTETLLGIPAWDTHFRRPFLFEQPVLLEAGTVLAARWTIDNSADNLANPSSPPGDVAMGAKATDELVDMVLWVSPVNRSDAVVLADFQFSTVRARIRSRGQPRPPIPGIR